MKATEKRALLLLILLAWASTGCSHLILRPDDNPVETTAKVSGRILLGVVTLPALLMFQHSEFRINDIKNSAPITDGFHIRLPPPNTTIVVLGNHPNATGAAITWLQKRGLNVVERMGLSKVINEQAIRLSNTPDDEAIYFKVGHLIGASLIVFVDSSTTGGAVSHSSFAMTQYGGSGGSYATTVSSNGITVRAVDLESATLTWTGHARYSQMDNQSSEDALVKLTCQALATAWGFRPPGDHFIPSQEMCSIQAISPESGIRGLRISRDGASPFS